jgi:hypothetical protein
VKIIFPSHNLGPLDIDLRSGSKTLSFEGYKGTAFTLTFLKLSTSGALYGLAEEAQLKGNADGTIYLDDNETADIKMEISGTNVTFTKLSTCSVKGSKEFKLSEAAKDKFIENKAKFYSSFNFIISDPEAPSEQVSNSDSTIPATAEKTENIDKKQKNTSLNKPKAGKKSIKLSWKKVTAKGIKGYEIQCSTDKDFKKDIKTVNIKKTKTTATKIKKLKSKKKYYVRIRTYKKSGSDKVYSNWSKVKSVKVK